MADKSRPLSGIRVIDFTSMMSGPVATRLLADCGADVIKIEAPEGDYMRYRSPVREGASSYYGQMNCGKKSIVIDLKTPKGVELARSLIATADVVVENYRPGVMTSLGLDYASLKDAFPNLIYCSISGFGQVGANARNPAYAPIIHAASGLDMAQLRCNSHLERPQMTGIFTADVSSAVHAFAAIQTALFNRERRGGGDYIDVSLQNCVLHMLVYECQEAQFPVQLNRPLYQPLKSRDGFVMVAPVNPKNFDNLCDALGHSEWRTDPRFATIRAREHNWAQLMQLVEAWTIERTGAECEDTLMKAGVPCARYKSVAELVADQELRSDGSLAEVADRAGAYWVPNPPFKFANASAVARPWVAALDENQSEVLREVLGLAESEIAELARSGALGRNNLVELAPELAQAPR
jgi:crotonobetainyl-CoA:carnitine CoA-transferase CaiB-like acyl-CoA transferase